MKCKCILIDATFKELVDETPHLARCLHGETLTLKAGIGTRIHGFWWN